MRRRRPSPPSRAPRSHWSTEANDHGDGLRAAGALAEPDHRVPGQIPDHRRSGTTPAQAFTPYPGDHRRPAHRHHRRDPGHRRQSRQHLDGDQHAARRRLGHRPDRARARGPAGAQGPPTPSSSTCTGAPRPSPAPTRNRSRSPSSSSKAGADIVIGSNAHVLLGAGYLGSAYVDYGLGNFAFYDNSRAGDRQRLARHHRGGPSRHSARRCGRPRSSTGCPSH